MPIIKRYLSALQADKLIAFLVGVALVVVNAIRIVRVNITHDETGYYAGDSYLHLMKNNFASANNHIFHSVLRKFFIQTFGDTIFFMRFDSLLAQIVFLIFLYKLCRFLFKDRWWTLLVFISLNTLSPLIFEFWGLGRGYALGLSMMTVSIFCLLKYLDAGRNALLNWAFITAILAVYSNFAFLNYFVTVLGVLLVNRLLFRGARFASWAFFREWLVALFFIVLLGLLISVPLINVMENGELQFLGSSGFLSDTVSSLLREGLRFCSFSSDLLSFLLWFIVIIVVAEAVYWIYRYQKDGKRDSDKEIRTGIILYVMLAIPVLSVVSQFHLLGINYLIDRAALFFILLFFIQLFYFIWFVTRTARKAGLTIIVVLFVLSSFNFLYHINLYQTQLWWYNRDDKSVLDRINRTNPQTDKKITVWVNWLQYHCYLYNARHYYNGRFELANTGQPYDTTYDYFVVPVSDMDNVPKIYTRDTQVVGGGFVVLKKTGN